VVRRVVVTCGVLASVLLAAQISVGADTGLRRVPVVVTPSTGSPVTTFVLSFRAPERTGLYGSSQRHDLVVASSASPDQGSCVRTLSIRAPDAHAGARVRVRLVPDSLGGRWCVARYNGRIEEIQTAVCPHGTLCPTYVLLRGIVGRFVFHVSGSGDNTPPTFAGLQEAFACTPGPQQPGQTTPYTLSWQTASDNTTPGTQIKYDIYLASAPGAENFSTPTWTTPPGTTSYHTPGLPSHGSYYFVVRARDSAGNHDDNTVEKHGIDPCY
jgi:hypothetical protein